MQTSYYAKYKGDNKYMQFVLEVYIEADSLETAKDIAHDIHEILGNNGINNSINVINDTNDEKDF